MKSHTESQKLRAGWLYVAMVVTFIGVLGSAYQEGSLYSSSFMITFCLLLVLFTLLLAARLKLSFNEKGLRYRFFPFHLQTHEILWKEVEEAQLLDFSALAEYGGWGIRYNFFSKTKAFVPRSGPGLLLKLHNGRKRLFSIEQPEQVRRITEVRIRRTAS